MAWNPIISKAAQPAGYELKQLGGEPDHIEGRATGWILLDYGSVIVHVFTPESREYYNLERLWSDAQMIDLSDVVSGN